MSERQYHLKFGGSAAASVDAYLEYKRIVGDDDGGKLFTPQEYEDYKKKVLPVRLENRLFTAWVSSSLMDCKLIGPETLCFCQHRYRQHKTDFETLPTERPIHLPCRVKKCPCKSYHYVPLNGTQPIRCRCKHYTVDHSSKEPYLCNAGDCSCDGFSSAYTCGCGEPLHQHRMIVETRDERLARGHSVGRDVPYQAMGGLTGFSSLMDGYLRLDPSGAGAPPIEFLNQPITSSDHPFLRGNVESIKADRLQYQAISGNPGREVDDADLAERMSALRRPGESDMDYFERRYQERLKAEKRQARGLPSTSKFTTGRRSDSDKNKTPLSQPQLTPGRVPASRLTNKGQNSRNIDHVSELTQQPSNQNKPAKTVNKSKTSGQRFNSETSNSIPSRKPGSGLQFEAKGKSINKK